MRSEHTAPTRIVEVASGQLAGIPGNDTAITVFRGVPFAAPPIDALRWRAPEAPQAWEGLRVADTFGPICPQHTPPLGSFYQEEFYLQPEAQSEDCLYLNIWTAAATGEPRPVMVWFHGGGFVEGSGSLPSFHGETLARKGVVLVTVNYRLGVFGFFAHPKLSAENEHSISGNYGLLDQIAALAWVQQNIAAFGGDPKNVTIFGQSAGSMSVFALSVSPQAKGLFKRAIGQSGSSFSFRNVRTLAAAEQVGIHQATQWGAATLAELRTLSAETLLGHRGAVDFATRPGLNVDGWVLPGLPAQLVATGQQHAESLLVGATADEFTSLGGFGPQGQQAFVAEAHQRYGARTEQFLALYSADSDQAAQQAQIASQSDLLFAGMQAWANAHAAHHPNNVYLYYFDRRLPGRNSAYYGAFHSGDLYYVFGTLASTERPWEVTDYALADAMTSYWANFAATGDPNSPGVPVWPTYKPDDPHAMQLGTQIGSMPLPKPARLQFFRDDIANWLKEA